MKVYLNTSKIINNLKLREGIFTYSKYAVHKLIFKNYSRFHYNNAPYLIIYPKQHYQNIKCQVKESHFKLIYFPRYFCSQG